MQENRHPFAEYVEQHIVSSHYPTSHPHDGQQNSLRWLDLIINVDEWNQKWKVLPKKTTVIGQPVTVEIDNEFWDDYHIDTETCIVSGVIKNYQLRTYGDKLTVILTNLTPPQKKG